MSNIAFDHTYIILNSISFTTSYAKNKQLFFLDIFKFQLLQT
jgi:hypothetical protein